MITLRRAAERRHDERSKREVWFTFFPKDEEDPLAQGFGTLEILNEDRLSPGTGILRDMPYDAEIITYVRDGVLAHEDSEGHSGFIHPGEFQIRTTGHGISHSETNASHTNWVHIFQIWLRPPKIGFDQSSQEQRRFSKAERRGGLCLIASPDARNRSLRIHQDVLVYAAVLYHGQHIIYELAKGRRAWLHLVQGEISLAGEILRTGDGVGIIDERVVSLTAQKETELLLLDIGSIDAEGKTKLFPSN